jgi:hypothetical protein
MARASIMLFHCALALSALLVVVVTWGIGINGVLTGGKPATMGPSTVANASTNNIGILLYYLTYSPSSIVVLGTINAGGVVIDRGPTSTRVRIAPSNRMCLSTSLC